MLIKTSIEIVISISECGKVRCDVIIEKPYEIDTNIMCESPNRSFFPLIDDAISIKTFLIRQTGIMFRYFEIDIVLILPDTYLPL